MVHRPYIGMEQVYHEKVNVVHSRSKEFAVAELKVLKLNESDQYPDGFKYSMFLVSLHDGRVIIGLDNHDPKGPHFHRGEEELSGYGSHLTVEMLVEEFWRLTNEAGYVL